jgi:DNA-binding transcriptional LysR family regulator
VETWDEPFAWVRSPRFFLTHGQPIPIVARAGWLAEHPMIRALETAGMPYEIVFASPDHHARIAAVSAGIGLCAIPKRLMPPSLVVASDRTLPPLPKVRGAIYRHPSVRRHESDWLISLLKTLHPGTSHHRQRDTDSEATSKMMKSSISQGGQIR